MQKTYRIIKSELDNDILIVKVPEFGFEIHYKINHITTIDPLTKYDDGSPDVNTDVGIEYIKTVKYDNLKTQDQIAEILKKESIIPPKLVYDHILLGFVYADDTDPNNFRWWLDFRDKKNQVVYNYWADNIQINSPITTKSWHDEDPNGIWHGRMVLSHSELNSIMEQKPGSLVINGKLRKECKPLKQKNICSSQNIPEKTESLRLRYNIREDLWFCDILDKEDKEIGVIPCKNIICDAKMYGQIFVVGNKRMVSTRININDVSEVGIAINSLIIRKN